MEQVKVDFLDGLAYCELLGAYTKKYNEDTLMVSRNGDPMMMLKWSVTDRAGNTGKISDHITNKMSFKIQNLCNVLKIRNFYDEESGQFRAHEFIGKSCCAVIKRDEAGQFGSKIVKYIPIAYSEMVSSGKDFAASTEKSEKVQRQVDQIKNDAKQSSESKKSKPSWATDDILDEDDYPF